MSKLPNTNELAGFLDEAVARFNAGIDRKTLLAARNQGLEEQVRKFRVAHEQAVTHRLAFYLECSLRRRYIVTDDGPLVVDCEYNQHLFDRKLLRMFPRDARVFTNAGRSKISVKGRTTLSDFEIRPDVLVHQRGIDGPTNLLVLEIKRWTNVERKLDQVKLRLLTERRRKGFGYALGAAVYIRNDREEPNRRVLQVGLRFSEGAQL